MGGNSGGGERKCGTKWGFGWIWCLRAPHNAPHCSRMLPSGGNSGWEGPASKRAIVHLDCVHPHCAVCNSNVLCAPLLDCVHPHCALWILTGLCAPIFCCVHPHCAVRTLTGLCALTFYFCAYGCSAVWSHIIFVKAHKANIFKPNILKILGLLVVVHSRLCALCTFHNAQYGSYIM